MKLLNKAQIVFIFTLGLVITVIVNLPSDYESFEAKKPPETLIYQPNKILDLPYLSEQYLNYLLTGRNPFVSPMQKTPDQAKLELPQIILKKPSYNLWTPSPDNTYYNTFIYTIPLNKPQYRYSVTPLDKSDLPNLKKLVPLDKIQQFIETTNPNLVKETKKITDTPDYIYFMDNAFSKGKILMEDNEKVIFQEEGNKFPVSYPKSKIRKIERVYSLEEQYAQKVKELNAKDFSAHYDLARWCVTQGLITQALVEIEQAIKLNNTFIDLYLLAGDLYRRQMDLNNELRIYQQAINLPVLKKEIFYLRLGELYGLLNRNEEAIEAFKSAATVAPTNFSTWLKLSYAYFQMGEYNLSEDNYKKAYQIAPLDSGVVVLKGLLLFKKGILPEAQTVLKSILDKMAAEKQDISIIGKDEVYAVLGVINVLTKDYPSALNWFMMAVQSNPYRASHWVNLSLLYMLAGDTEISSVILTEAIKRDPSSALPYLAQGYLAWSQDRINEAIHNFQEAAKIEPFNSLVLYAQGQAHFDKDELTEASQIFSTLVKKKPLINDCLYYLGVIAFQNNKFSDSALFFKLYLKKLAGKPLPGDYATLGIVHLSLNQFNIARSYFDQALNINPQFAPALNGLAYLEYKNNQSAKAIDYFSNVLKWYRDDIYASGSIKAIKEAESQVIWKDLFNRPDNNTVGEGWTEKELFGIEIEINYEKLYFKGTQVLQDNGVTYLERPINQDNFIRLEADLGINEINRACVGIYIASKEEKTKGTIFYAIMPSEAKNKVAWQFSNSSEPVLSNWNEIPVVVSSLDPVKLEIQKVISDNNQIELKIWLNNKQVNTTPIPQAKFIMNAKSCALGIFGYAPLGTKWELLVKNIRVTEKK